MQSRLATRAPRLAAARSARPAARTTVRVQAAGSPYKWLNKDPLAFALGFLGWTVPASSPSPSFGEDGSLFGALTHSISRELANFPQGPALDSNFWILLITYHVGLFVALTLAQIGVQGRKQGYFD